jgi:hAT family C-terminal dimerisation region
MALDALAVPAMSDECERLFSSAKILLSDHCSRLRMDIIEASECLRAWHGPPPRKTFDDKAVGVMEGEHQAQEDKEHEEHEDTGDTDGSDAEDEPQIIDQEGAGGEEDAGAGTADEGDEIYSV